MWRLVPVFVSVLVGVPAQRLPEASEPNGSPATATVLPAGREAFGVLSAGDSDWYRVVLTTAGELEAETGPGYGNEVGDTWLGLFDAAGSPLRGNDDVAGRGRYSRLRLTAQPAGTYYLAVEAGSFGAAGGSYSLDLRLGPSTSGIPGSVAAEAAEPNDPRTGGLASVVVLPARVDGQLASVGPAGDWDFHRFVLAAEQLVRVRVDATASQPSLPRADDPVLYLFDGATPPQRLAGPFQGSSFGSYDAGFDVRLPAGTWQVAIRGVYGSSPGRYVLDVMAASAADVAVFAGGCGGRHLDIATTQVGPLAPLRTERPMLGTTWCVRGDNLGAGGFVFHVVGLQAQLVDLTPFGAPGCTLEVVHIDTPLQLADAAGATTFAVALPTSSALVGTTLHSQLAVFDFSNALGLSFSNRVAAVLGP